MSSILYLCFVTVVLHCTLATSSPVRVKVIPHVNRKYVNPIIGRALNDIQAENLIGNRRIVIVYPNGTNATEDSEEHFDLIMGALTKQQIMRLSNEGVPTISTQEDVGATAHVGAPAVGDLVRVLTNITGQFHFRQVALVTIHNVGETSATETSPLNYSIDCNGTIHGIKDRLQRNQERSNLNISLLRTMEKNIKQKGNMYQFESVLKDSSFAANIIIFCTENVNDERSFIETAIRLKMTQSGKYAFINVGRKSSDHLMDDNAYTNDGEKTEIQQNLKAFKYITQPRTHKTQLVGKLNTWVNVWKRARRQGYMTEHVPGYVVMNQLLPYYEALKAFATALNKTVGSDRGATDPKLLKQMLRNVTFKGLLNNYTLDQRNGRRNLNLSVETQPADGKFMPAKLFTPSNNRWHDLGPVYWPKGGPPTSFPICGFDFSLCPPTDETSSWWLFLLPLLALVAMLLLAIVMFRRKGKKDNAVLKPLKFTRSEDGYEQLE